MSCDAPAIHKPHAIAAYHGLPGPRLAPLLLRGKRLCFSFCVHLTFLCCPWNEANPLPTHPTFTSLCSTATRSSRPARDPIRIQDNEPSVLGGRFHLEPCTPLCNARTQAAAIALPSTRCSMYQLARTRAASIPRTVRRCGTLLVCSPNQICFTRILLLVRSAALYAKKSPRVSAKCCSDVPCVQEGAKTMRFLFSNKNSSQRGSPQLTAFFVPLSLFFYI